MSRHNPSRDDDDEKHPVAQDENHAGQDDDLNPELPPRVAQEIQGQRAPQRTFLSIMRAILNDEDGEYTEALVQEFGIRFARWVHPLAGEFVDVLDSSSDISRRAAYCAILYFLSTRGLFADNGVQSIDDEGVVTVTQNEQIEGLRAVYPLLADMSYNINSLFNSATRLDNVPIAEVKRRIALVITEMVAALGGAALLGVEDLQNFSGATASLIVFLNMMNSQSFTGSIPRQHIPRNFPRLALARIGGVVIGAAVVASSQAVGNDEHHIDSEELLNVILSTFLPFEISDMFVRILRGDRWAIDVLTVATIALLYLFPRQEQSGLDSLQEQIGNLITLFLTVSVLSSIMDISRREMPELPAAVIPPEEAAARRERLLDQLPIIRWQADNMTISEYMEYAEKMRKESEEEKGQKITIEEIESDDEEEKSDDEDVQSGNEKESQKSPNTIVEEPAAFGGKGSNGNNQENGGGPTNMLI